MFGARIVSGFVFFLACAAAQNVISTVAGGNPPFTPSIAVNASVGDPSRVATDAAGNFYFGGLHSVFRVNPGGTLTRIAGTGRAGYAGDGGPATQAQFLDPAGMVVDSNSNIFVADRAAAVIRKIQPNGTIGTVAGTGTAGYSGDGGPATQAQLNQPMGLAVDRSGNLYIADSANHRVRRIAGDGTISTVAGTGSAGYNGDGGPATGSQLNQPEGVAVDASGNLYIADTVNDRVRAVTGGGNIATVAGTGLSAVYGSIFGETGAASTTGDNGPATSAAVVLPTDVAVDGPGNLYIADYGNARIRSVSKGVITSVAGSVAGGIGLTSGQAALSVALHGPTGVAVDGSGDVYFAEGSIGTGSGLATGDYQIWQVNTAGILNVAAGNGLESYAGDGGAAALAQLNGPAGIAIDSQGTLYLADSANHRIRRIKATGAIDTIAGTGVPGFSGDGGPAVSAQLNGPLGVAVDASANVYVADTNNNRIRVISANGVIGTLAGNGNASFYGDGLPATEASVHAPEGLAVTANGTLYVADTMNQRVRRITPDNVIQTVAGNGATGFTSDGSDATQVALNQPAAVALDGAGNLYIADQGNNRVREVSPQGSIVTVAGGVRSPFPNNGDGSPATSAQLASPRGVALDGAGNLYIAEAGGRLRQVAGNGTISTLAGNGACCYTGDGGPAAAASLDSPWNVAVDAAGDVFFTDYGDDAVRAVAPAPATPAIASVVNGASNQVAALAPGEVVVVYGSGLGPGQLVQAANSSLTALAGVSVLFNGVPGQMLYAFSGQVSAVAPPGLAGTSAQVVVTHGELASESATLALAPASPALFTLNDSGSGQAAATNADGSLNAAGNAAAGGSTLTLLATGLGGFAPAVTIGGQSAAVLSTNFSAPGVTAITVQVPGGLGSGPVAVSVQTGGISSPNGVTVTLK